MKFNINNYVTVTLTPAGAQRLKDQHLEFYNWMKGKGRTTIQTPEEFNKSLDETLSKNDMKYRMQGWHFMEKLGYQCGPGHPQLFETIIEMDDGDLFE